MRSAALCDRRTMCASLLAASLALPGCAKRQKPSELAQPDPKLWAPPAGVSSHETFATGPNGQVYVRTFGASGIPLVLLHGGPAAAHGYMIPYARLADQRQIVFYDQSGCGRSASPADLGLYTVDRYVDELEAVRDHIGATRMILLGHSWGGSLAQAYVARHPDRVAGLILSGSLARWSEFNAAAAHWLDELGPDAVETVRKAEASGKTDGPAYGKLVERYYNLHLCRLKQWPKFLTDAGEAVSRNPVYIRLNGPSEFQATGNLSNLDTSDAARGIRVPTLVACGEFDEAAPLYARRLANLIPNARFAMFNNLSHMHHIEDPARVVGATRAFIAGIP